MHRPVSAAGGAVRCARSPGTTGTGTGVVAHPGNPAASAEHASSAMASPVQPHPHHDRVRCSIRPSMPVRVSPPRAASTPAAGKVSIGP